MKLVNYQLLNKIEYINENKTNSQFKQYLQSILEDTSKPYYQRADYIGLSLNEMKNKIDYLSQDITELQNLKKRLTSALDIAKTLTADIFKENGIDRIDGNKISSLTLTKPSSKNKQVITVKDEQKVMALGYVSFSVDLKAIEEAIKTKKGLEELSEFIDITSMNISVPEKIKINTKRISANNKVETDEILITEEKIA